ncbi:polysaccharide biosynthesis protein [Lactococcus lactis subsp. lactis]|nr:polysaccharide biosynthesis protein [Lactococcus lactis subsp. lactis]
MDYQVKIAVHLERPLSVFLAIPFIVIGSAIQIFKIIDNSTFMNMMPWVTNYSHNELLVLMSYFSANTDKLTMVLLGVALTLGSVSDPLITEHYVQGNRRELATLVGYNFQLYVGFMLPAVYLFIKISSF